MNSTLRSSVRKTIIGVQFLFVAFGATVLVPLLVGLDPSIALFTAGVGTLLFHLVTKGKVPIFLGSSFAFIAPIIEATKHFGLPGTLFGLLGVSLVYFLMSALIKWQGVAFIQRLFPPVVIGPVIILIGLTLASSGVNMAKENWPLALIALFTAVIITIYAKGLLKLVPVFAGIVVAYITAYFMGVLDFTEIHQAAWFSLPHFVTPSVSWKAVLYMMPVAIAPVIEHVGDIYVVNTVAQKDFVKDPGLHRTILGDGLACLVSAFLGGPPVTTYSEVTGAMALTKMTNPEVIRIAAVAGILFSVIGKVSAFLRSIPSSILGGIMLLLFGTIACAGITNLVKNQVDFQDTRNTVIASLILTIGIGGAQFSVGGFSMAGIGLASLIGVFLNLIIPPTKK